MFSCVEITNFFAGSTVYQELQVTIYHIKQSFIRTYSQSGRHCCLWCLVQSSRLKTPPSARQPAVLRTTESISSDYERFEKAGKNIKQAKNFNNVIEKPFFASWHRWIQIENELLQLLNNPLHMHVHVGLPSRTPHHPRHIHAHFRAAWRCLSPAGFDCQTPRDWMWSKL